ncbi:MAG: M12 family metallo-peptidase [Bacteroidia bacterium]|nr:M12 family metallo-peptidase [Bacteroidia bacterium]
MQASPLRLALILTVLCASWAAAPLRAQRLLWADAAETETLRSAVRDIVPARYRTLSLDRSELERLLVQAPMERSGAAPLLLELPLPDGSFAGYHVWESPVMQPGLAAAYPAIRTYLLAGVTQPGAHGRMDLTPSGFHAILHTPGATIYIDPYHRQTDRHYISYYLSDFQTDKLWRSACGTGSSLTGPATYEPGALQVETLRSSGAELRTYRLAVSVTAEYTSFHGGTANALAAIVTSVNRINSIYEAEVGIRLLLVDNTNLLIYTNAATDPFTNGNTPTMLNQNQQTVDAVIGQANYDIGHVFGTGDGGIAQLGSVCVNGSKARGATASGAPVGDPFDVDYVAHEMGHQFGANHTFNSTTGGCDGNREPGSAYEPGSGSTIMAYAGLCAPNNLQSNSDPYFHTHSYDEIRNFILTGSGNSCAVSLPTGNLPPTVDAGPSGYYIPRSTPFQLTGTASDPDGDALTYSWEQLNIGPATAANSPAGTAPSFRSFAPSVSPVRVFPRLQNILANTNSNGEVLPAYARGMRFRLTVRDNRPGGGGVAYDTCFFRVTDQAGPFLVTNPNTQVTWIASTYTQVAWDRANTHLPPVSCSHVNILLSSDGGLTYPDTLAWQVPNTGLANVLVPNISTTQARVRVEASGNIFFDLSNRNFTISPSASAGFTLFAPQPSVPVCPGSQAVFEVLTTSLLGFADPVQVSASGLPAGYTASFSQNPFVPGDTVFVTVQAPAVLSGNPLIFNLLAFSAGGATDLEQLTLTPLNQGPPGIAQAAAPLTGASGLSLQPILVWGAAPTADSYRLELSTAPDFSGSTVYAGIADTSFRLPVPLASTTPYYWRVQAVNACGTGPYSPLSAFQTGVCQRVSSTNVPLNIPAFGAIPIEVNSTMNVPVTPGLISDVNVVGLRGTHTGIQDLELSLFHPGGTPVLLFSSICTRNDENFDLVLDEDAAAAPIACPPLGGLAYRPQGLLSSLDGLPAGGSWRLRVRDLASFEGGSLTGWGLEICTQQGLSPELVINQPLAVTRWYNATISNTRLLADDGQGTPANLTFTLVSLPEWGWVQLDGVSLGIGGTFTQADLNLGRVRYQHGGDPLSTADSFTFTVANTSGGWLGIPAFQVAITQTTAADPASQAFGVQLQPNPASGMVQVRLQDAPAGAVQLTLTTLHGQQIRSYRGLPNGSGVIELPLDGLASGLYLLDIQAGGSSVVRRLAVE